MALPRQSSSLPPLGDVYLDPDRTCMRLLRAFEGRESLCGKPAVVHVEWGTPDHGEAAGFICEEHRGDLERWSSRTWHAIGSCCGMPGALWYEAYEGDRIYSWCAVPGDGVETTEPVRAVAQEIPA